MKRWWMIFGLGLQGFLVQSALAQSSYFENASAQAWLKQQTQNDAALRGRYETVFKALYRDDSVLQKIARPAEKAKPWFEYRKIFEDEARLNDGIAFYLEHQSALARAEAEFGVDARIIVAILGVETRYGKVMGKTEVLQSLATLCFDYPPRAKFFCAQLADSMRLLDQLQSALGVNPLEVRGSYAGAMGMAQFMPSSYLNDAVDFDGDGKIDLFHSPTDAIGSIANYLKNRGWQAGGAYAYPLPFKPNKSALVQEVGKNQKPSHKALWWVGEQQADSPEKQQALAAWLAIHGDELAGSLILEGAAGEEYWLTFNNFYAITRYNSSPMYAMSVVNLAEKIGIGVGR